MMFEIQYMSKNPDFLCLGYDFFLSIVFIFIFFLLTDLYCTALLTGWRCCPVWYIPKIGSTLQLIYFVMVNIGKIF